jgi:hypothetical protein
MLGKVETFPVVAEISAGPPILSMLPKWIRIVVLLVDRQRHCQIAAQFVEHLPFEARKSQFVCAREA